jgi:flagellar hook-length control protein FliK
MELVAALPPDLAALADPTARAAAAPLRPTDKDDAAAAAAGPFDLLLAMLTTALPGGETLPATGNALPAAAVDGGGDPGCATLASAKPITSLPATAVTGADLLARLKLSAVAATNDDAAVPATPAADAESPAQPFADLADLADSATAKSAAPPPVTSAEPAAPALPATTPAAPPTDTALDVALQQTVAAEPGAKPVRAGPARDAAHAVAKPMAADLRATSPDSPVAAPPVGEVTDAATRPTRREATFDFDALPVTATAAPADTAAPTPSAPALAPAHAHSTGTPAAASAAAAAAPSAPIDTRADNWHEALASRVQVLVDQNVGEAHIKLNPPELGAVDIKISLVDDKTFVQLTAGTSAARDELTQSLPRLRELLSASGLSLGGTSVHGGSAGQSGRESAPHFAAPAYRPFAAADDEALLPVRAAARAAGRIDLFA